MVRDQAAQRVREAKAAAQAAIDAAKAVELSAEDKVALLQEIGKVTEIENPSEDAEESAKQQADALKRAKAFRKQFRNVMKDLQRKSDAAEDEFGDSSEQFVEAEKAYYLQKAKVDLITDVVNTTK